jgi:ankyrin repeat protein
MLKKINEDLFKAIETEDSSAIADLITEGAELDARDAFDYTPLHAAAVMDNPEICTMLIKAGADTQAKVNNKTPAQFALESLCTECYNFLMKYDNEKQNKGGVKNGK